MTDRAEWERQLTEELSFAVRTGSKFNLSDLSISLAEVPDGKLTAEVLRRGDKLDLAGALVQSENRSAPDWPPTTVEARRLLDYNPRRSGRPLSRPHPPSLGFRCRARWGTKGSAPFLST